VNAASWMGCFAVRELHKGCGSEVCYGGRFRGSGCDVHAAGAEVCGPNHSSFAVDHTSLYHEVDGQLHSCTIDVSLF
jgi:hypothetical protein